MYPHLQPVRPLQKGDRITFDLQKKMKQIDTHHTRESILPVVTTIRNYQSAGQIEGEPREGKKVCIIIAIMIIIYYHTQEGISHTLKPGEQANGSLI
jgi:hypothetical protein